MTRTCVKWPQAERRGGGITTSSISTAAIPFSRKEGRRGGELGAVSSDTSVGIKKSAEGRGLDGVSISSVRTNKKSEEVIWESI